MNNFAKSLAMSHEAEDLPIWGEIYREAFPGMVAMPNHREDGEHQRKGIDRSVILENSKQLLIDEKVRGRNRITGKVYDDIALEYLSDRERNAPGWVCKPLLCDYIAYAITPLGKCYLMPVLQLQQAWRNHKKEWLQTYPTIRAENKYNGRQWQTLSCCIPPKIIFSAIGQCLRIRFSSYELEEDR